MVHLYATNQNIAHLEIRYDLMDYISFTTYICTAIFQSTLVILHRTSGALYIYVL